MKKTVIIFFGEATEALGLSPAGFDSWKLLVCIRKVSNQGLNEAPGAAGRASLGGVL